MKRKISFDKFTHVNIIENSYYKSPKSSEEYPITTHKKLFSKKKIKKYKVHGSILKSPKKIMKKLSSPRI